MSSKHYSIEEMRFEAGSQKSKGGKRKMKSDEWKFNCVYENFEIYRFDILAGIS